MKEHFKEVNMSKYLISLLKVICIVLISTAAFAETSPLIIYTWGYGDLLYMVFQAIMFMTDNNGFIALFKIAATTGIIASIIYCGFTRDFSLYSIALRFGFSIFIWSLITVNSNIGANTDIQIYDVYTNTNSKPIEDVPLGFAGPIGFFSKMEYWLNQAVQSAFGITDAGIAASGAGYVPPSIGSGLIYSASQFRITDPNLYMTMNDYITDCVFPDVLTGYFDPNDLRVSDTFWISIADTHPARVSKVYDPVLYKGKNGKIVSCPEVWKYLDTAFNTYIPDAANYLNRSMGLSAEVTAGTMLGTSLKKVMNIAQDGQAFLLNSVALNAFDDAVQSAAAMGGVSSDALGFGLAKAQESTRANMVLTGIQAKKYLPMTKGILICVLLCGMPVFLAFAVAMVMPSKLFGMIAGMYLAPCFWALGDTVLNAIIMVRASGYIENWGITSGITAQIKPIVETQALEMVNMVTSMYWIIPTISLGFATMSAYGLSSISSSVMGAATAGTGGASSEMGSGSVSFGNASYNNTNANKLDSYRGIEAGSGFGWRQTYSNRSQSSIVNSNEGVYGKSTIEKPTADGGKIITESIGGNMVRSEERVGSNGKAIGGLNFQQGSMLITYGSGANARTEITGNTELGDTRMIMSGDKTEWIEAKAGQNSRYEQVRSEKGVEFHHGGKVMYGADVSYLGEGTNSTALVTGTDEKGRKASWTITGAELKPVYETDGSATGLKANPNKVQAVGGSLAHSHASAGSSEDIQFKELKLNGKTLTGGTIKSTEDGAVVSGYSNGTRTTMLVNNFRITGSESNPTGGVNYTANGAVVDTEAKSTDTGTYNRDVLTLNGGQLNLKGATITQKGNLSVIDGANADGTSYKAMVYGLKDNGGGNWSGVVTNSTALGNVASEEVKVGKTAMTTGTDGTWTQIGKLRTYEGSVSWKDSEGVSHLGKGSITMQGDKVLYANATDGYQLLHAENNRIEFKEDTAIAQGMEGKGTFQATADGNSHLLKKALNSMDEYKDARNAYFAYAKEGAKNFRAVESGEYDRKLSQYAAAMGLAKNKADSDQYAYISSLTTDISAMASAKRGHTSTDSFGDNRDKTFGLNANADVSGSAGVQEVAETREGVPIKQKPYETGFGKPDPITKPRIASPGVSASAGAKYGEANKTYSGHEDKVQTSTEVNLMYQKLNNLFNKHAGGYDGDNEKLDEVEAAFCNDIRGVMETVRKDIAKGEKRATSDEKTTAEKVNDFLDEKILNKF
jgi:hypothetical protein